MPVEASPITFWAHDLVFDGPIIVSLDWRGIITRDTRETLIDAWLWKEIAQVTVKNRANCKVTIDMVSKQKKKIRLARTTELNRFFDAIARFYPVIKSSWMALKKRVVLMHGNYELIPKGRDDYSEHWVEVEQARRAKVLVQAQLTRTSSEAVMLPKDGQVFEASPAVNSNAVIPTPPPPTRRPATVHVAQVHPQVAPRPQNFIDELQSNFAAGVFMPKERPKLPDRIVITKSERVKMPTLQETPREALLNELRSYVDPASDDQCLKPSLIAGPRRRSTITQMAPPMLSPADTTFDVVFDEAIRVPLKEENVLELPIITPILKYTPKPRNLLREMNEVATSTRTPSPTRMLMRHLSDAKPQAFIFEESFTPKLPPQKASSFTRLVTPRPPPEPMAPRGVVSELKSYANILHSQIKPSFVAETNKWNPYPVVPSPMSLTGISNQECGKVITTSSLSTRIWTCHVDILKDIAQSRASAGQESFIKPSELKQLKLARSACPPVVVGVTFKSTYTPEDDESEQCSQVTSTSESLLQNVDFEEECFEPFTSVYEALAGPFEQETSEDILEDVDLDFEQHWKANIPTRDMFTIYEDGCLEEELMSLYMEQNEQKVGQVTPIKEPQTPERTMAMRRLSVASMPSSPPSPTGAEKNYPVEDMIQVKGTMIKTDPRLICTCCDWISEVKPCQGRLVIVSINGILHRVSEEQAQEAQDEGILARFSEVYFLLNQYDGCDCQNCMVESWV